MKTLIMEFQNIPLSKSEHFTLLEPNNYCLHYFPVLCKRSKFSVEVQCATANRLKYFVCTRN